jgi:hypothetical protein
MEFDTWRKTGALRSAAAVGWLRVVMLACLLAVLVIGATIYLGGDRSHSPLSANSEPSARSDKLLYGPVRADQTRHNEFAREHSRRASNLPVHARSPTELESGPHGPATQFLPELSEQDDEAAQTSAAIQGSVLDDAGEPLPGRVVTAQALGFESGRLVSATAVTDRLGMFGFQSLPANEYLLRVAEDAEFHAGVLRVRSGVDSAEIYLQRKGSISVSGQVRDELAQPVAAVRVRALGDAGSETSDQNGRFEIEVDRVKPGTSPVLEFSHADYQTVRERIDMPRGRATALIHLDVVMPGRGDTVAVSGWVSGPSSEPVSDALVWLSSASPPASHRTRTDSLGAYEFGQVEIGEHYRLGVEPKESTYQRYLSQPESIDHPHIIHDVRLEGAGEAEISGVLLDPSGRPLPGFGIWLRQLQARAPAPVFIQSDQRGQFAPVRVRSGPIRLETQSSPQLQATGIELEPGESHYLQIPLDWGQAWLIGQVVDDRDRPVPQAEVVIQWRSTGHEVTSASRRAARVDQAGFFSFANLGASRYQLTASAPGFESRRIVVSPAFGEEILIALHPQPAAGEGP